MGTDINSAVTAKPTVLLVEGNHFLRDALRDWLQQAEEVHLIGEVANGVDAVAQTLHLNPCVILVDVSLSDMSGLVLARLIHRLRPKTHIVLLLDENDQAYRDVALEMGVGACVVKTAPSQELLMTLRQSTGEEVS